MTCTAPIIMITAPVIVTMKLILEQFLMLNYMVRMLLDQMKFITQLLTHLSIVNILAVIIGISMILTEMN